MPTSFTLGSIRAQATKIFAYVAWANVFLVGAVALIGRNPPLEPMAVAALIALIATLSAWKLRDGLALRAIIAVCLTFGPILFVYAGRGHLSGIGGNGDWQVDYHMYFFGVFAMLTAYVDWRPIAISAALTAAHHLILDLVVPANVFPEEGIDRVALHAIAVVIECGVLFWVTVAIGALFKRLEDLVDLTSRETADALTREHETISSLQAQLNRHLAVQES
ncbi:MAG: putative methyl-accepting chemotaxis protein [Candidatus Eremiobacteraeota bacterium]|nr:putative methyl-accepting chemotaxis protein [Candidatus Eremiobacteraeota bacterium]